MIMCVTRYESRLSGVALAKTEATNNESVGSVRQIIDCGANVVKLYTYNPFGELIEEEGTFDNPFRFTGQYYDSEIDQYYLRARMYDPHLGRFTGRDPILGQFEEPITLHKYLYTQNNYINMTDLTGLISRFLPFGYRHYGLSQTRLVFDSALEWVHERGFSGAIDAFRHGGRYDYKTNPGISFELNTSVSGWQFVSGSQFVNWLTGYTTYYNFGDLGLGCSYIGGQLYGMIDESHPLGIDKEGYFYEDWGSMYWITQGALDANKRAQNWFKYEHKYSRIPKPFDAGAIDYIPLWTTVNSGLLKIDEAILTGNAQLYFALWFNSGGMD